MLDSLKGETFSPEAFQYFMSAFKSVVSCNMSAETFRSLALFVTYAIRKHRLPSVMPSRRKQSVMRNQKSSNNSPQRLSISTSSPSPRSKQTGSKDELTPAQLGISVLQMYTSFLCGDESTANIEKFARTVTNKVRVEPTIASKSETHIF